MEVRNKIFISDIDSEVGYELVETLRDDHINLDNHTIIIGTTTKSDQVDPILHPAIKHTIDPQQQFNLLIKSVLECDIIILDLRKPSFEIEYILKMLKISHATHPKLVIGLSTVATWLHTRPILKDVNDLTDKQLYFQKSLENKFAQPFHDQHYIRRIPHPNFNATYQLENMLLGLNGSSNLNGKVVCCGIIYGKTSSEILPRIIQSTRGQSIKCYGTGDNYLSMIHIDDLSQIILHLTSHPKIDKKYLIAVDPSPVLQAQFLQSLGRECGNKAPLNQQQLRYIKNEEVIFGASIRFQCSKEIHNFQWNSSNPLAFLPTLIQQFYQSSSIKPIQIYVETQKFTNQEKLQIIENLKNKFLIINEEYLAKLGTQLEAEKHNQSKQKQDLPKQDIEKRNTPQKEVSKGQKKKNSQNDNKLLLEQIEKLNKIGLQHVFETFKYQNHIIIASHNLIKNFSQKIQKYTKLLNYQSQNSIKFKSQIYNNISKIKQSIGIKPFEQQVTTQKNTLKDKKSMDNQVNCYSIKNEQTINQKIQFSQTKTANKLNIKQECKKNISLVNQYLVDNVIVYISQALYSIKIQNKEQNINNLLSQLKNLLKRQQIEKENNKFH